MIPSDGVVTHMEFQTPLILANAKFNYVYAIGYKPNGGQDYLYYASESDLAGQNQVTFSVDLDYAEYEYIRYYFYIYRTSGSISIDKTPAYYKVSYVPDSNMGYGLNVTDFSEDLDHHSRADKGIVEREWKIREKDTTEWNIIEIDSVWLAKNKIYELSMAVKDVEGSWSEPFTVEISTEEDSPPVADFYVKPTIIAGDDLGFVDLSYSPIGLEIVHRNLQYSFNGGSWVNDTIPPDTKTTAGTYEFKLYVEDENGQSDIAIKDVLVIAPNQAPIVSLTTNKINYYEDENVITTESASDPDGDPITTAMRHQLPNGVWKNGDIPSRPYTTYGQLGTYSIEYSATDDPTLRHPDLQPLTTTVTTTIEIELRNQPPTAGFTYSPSFIYEGDTINLTDTSTDPDNNISSHLWTIKMPDGSSYTVTTKNASITNAQLGTYQVKKKVTDSYGLWDETDWVSISVHELSVTGQVQHTTLWNEHRIDYNRSKSGTDDQPRTYDVFFPGEKLVLKAETTDIQAGSQVTADQVTVQILNPSYSAVLQNIGNNEWEGTLWSSEMLAWTSRTLRFRFTATYSNGTVKTDEVQIRIDDDPYWRQHGSY